MCNQYHFNRPIVIACNIFFMPFIILRIILFTEHVLVELFVLRASASQFRVQYNQLIYYECHHVQTKRDVDH